MIEVLILIVLAMGAGWYRIHKQTERRILMKLSELSTTLNTASDTLDAILARLPAPGADPELGPVNEAAVARLNASVEALNVATTPVTPP